VSSPASAKADVIRDATGAAAVRVRTVDELREVLGV
jgi:hypothetical protein